MDQIKIGKFIADERKQKKYTQKQLAEILEISVNELLSGERLAEVDYKKRAEENMVNFIKERDENKKTEMSLLWKKELVQKSLNKISFERPINVLIYNRMFRQINV